MRGCSARAEMTKRIGLQPDPGFVISPWCGEAKCEADIKTETQATIRNIPKGYEQAPGKPCIRYGPRERRTWGSRKAQ